MSAQPPTGPLARGLQVLLALELAVLGVGLGTLWHYNIISGLTWLLLGLGWYFGFRIVAVGKNFAQTYRHRTVPQPEHQIGLAKTLRLFWGEYMVTLLAYSFFFPFEAWLVPLAPKPAAEGNGLPILLVPGFCCNRGYWVLFVRWLRRAGLGPVYAVSLEPLLGSIEDNAVALARVVEAVCADTKVDKLVLIGHSMGGLVIRSYVHSGGDTRVAQAICLGSPHHGTVIANDLAALGENLRQMRQGSEWADRFNRNEALPCLVPITNIVTPHDNIVAPQASSLLNYPNARNVVLPGIGHLEMVISRPVFEATAAALRQSH